MDSKSTASIKKIGNMLYNNSMITINSKYHLTRIPLKKLDRAGIPKKNQWEFLMAIVDPENPGHYLKRGMIRLGTRIEGEARKRAAAYLLKCENENKRIEEEKAKAVKNRINIKTFFLTEVWKDGSPYVLDKKASGRPLSRAYIISSRQRIITYFLPWCEDNNILLLSDLGKAKLREWRNFLYSSCLEKGLSPGLVNNVRIAISTALEWAEANELIDVNYMLSVGKVKEEPSERQPYTPEEVIKLFSSDWPDERCKVAFMLAITTGLRLGELQGLKWANVDIIDTADAHLDVIEQYQEYLKQGFVPPKSRKPRLNVYIRKDVAEAMERLREKSPFHICVFNDPKKPGVPMDRNIFDRGLRAAAKVAGINLNGKLWHNARHTYLTYFSDEAGIEAASKSIGHSSTKTTSGYVHDTKKKQDREKKIIDGMFRKLA